MSRPNLATMPTPRLIDFERRVRRDACTAEIDAEGKNREHTTALVDKEPTRAERRLLRRIAKELRMRRKATPRYKSARAYKYLQNCGDNYDPFHADLD